MPRYNVNKPNTNEWACYSTITEDFVIEFMPRDQYQEWREREYGIHCGTIEEANLMSYGEAKRRRQFYANWEVEDAAEEET